MLIAAILVWLCIWYHSIFILQCVYVSNIDNIVLLVIRYQQPTQSLRKTWSKTKYGWESRILKYVRYLLKFAYFYDP